PPERLKPLALPTALELTLVVVNASVRMSGEAGWWLPDTTLLMTFRVLATRLVREMPPPPLAGAAPLAVLSVTVVSWRVMVPGPASAPIPPPEVPAVLPLMVVFCTKNVPVNPSMLIPPPPRAAVLPLKVLLRTDRALGVE